MEKVKQVTSEYLSSLIDRAPELVFAILTFVVGWVVVNLMTTLFRKGISRRSPDPLMINFLTKTFRIGMMLVVIMFALKVAGLGSIATSLLATAGASAIIIGFAFKDVGENFISGVILSFNRPFNVNDTVSIGEIFGKVKSMEFRYTKLKTFDGRDVYIPNSDIIKKAVYNYTEDGYFRLDFLIGIAFEDSIAKAQDVILKAISSTDDVFQDAEHETFVTVEELGSSTVNLRAYFWVETKEYRKQAYQIKSDVVEEVKNALMASGINMPANIQELKLYEGQKEIPVNLKMDTKRDENP